MKRDLFFNKNCNIVHSNECRKMVVKDEVNASVEVKTELHSA